MRVQTGQAFETWEQELDNNTTFHGETIHWELDADTEPLHQYLEEGYFIHVFVRLEGRDLDGTIRTRKGLAPLYLQQTPAGTVTYTQAEAQELGLDMSPRYTPGVSVAIQDDIERLEGTPPAIQLVDVDAPQTYMEHQ